jgi:hypothetical protein
MCQAQGTKLWYFKCAANPAVNVDRSISAALSDMPKGIGTGITKT